MRRNNQQAHRKFSAALALVLGLLMPATTTQAQFSDYPIVIPPNPAYRLLSARWWQWGLALPVEGHPFNGCPEPFNAGQSGPVWFLAGNYATTPCSGTVPFGKALFFPLANAECSSLESPPFYGATAEDQRDCAKSWANQIDVNSLFCEVDNVRVKHLKLYRFVTPQFEFTAPTPWVWGDVGGKGTAVGDGYYLLLAPLPMGDHTIHFGSGSLGIDTTFNLTVAP